MPFVNKASPVRFQREILVPGWARLVDYRNENHTSTPNLVVADASTQAHDVPGM
jgi:hypothetical protein